MDGLYNGMSGRIDKVNLLLRIAAPQHKDHRITFLIHRGNNRISKLLAKFHLRRQLAASSQTVPNQVNKPTDRPTMRWIFQYFEGIDLLHVRMGD